MDYLLCIGIVVLPVLAALWWIGRMVNRISGINGQCR